MKIFKKHGTKGKLFEMMERVNKIKLNESFDSPKDKDEKYLNKGGDEAGLEKQPNKYDDGVREPRERDIQVKDKSVQKLKGDDKPIVSENLDKSRFNKYIGKELEIGVIEDIDIGGGDFMIGFKQPAEIDTIQFTPNGAKIYKTEGGGFRDVTNDYKNGLGLVADKWLTLIWNEVSSQAREMGVDMADTFTGYRRSINQNNESSIIEGGLGNYDVYSSPEWVEARKEKFGDRNQQTQQNQQQPKQDISPEQRQQDAQQYEDSKSEKTLDYLKKTYINLDRQGQSKSPEGKKIDGQYYGMTGKHIWENNVTEETIEDTGEEESEIEINNLDTGEEEVGVEIEDNGEESIEGGLADGESPADFDPKQILLGMEVEMEHTNEPKEALEITMDHLVEDPSYYGSEGENPDMEAQDNAAEDAVEIEDEVIGTEDDLGIDTSEIEDEISGAEEAPEQIEDDDLRVNMNWLETIKPKNVDDMEAISTDLGEGFDEEEEFIPQGSYTVSNAGGFEIMLSDSGDEAKVRDAYGSDNPKVSDWLEIELIDNERIIDPDGYHIPLGQVMRIK